jgi:glutamate dehydrogenase
MPRHPLRREIVATMVANAMINRTGPVFVHRMQEETGASVDEVTRAFVLVRDVYGFGPLWAAIDALDNQVPSAVQAEMLIESGRLLLRATLWFLRRRRERLPIAEVLAIFQPGLAAFRRQLPEILSAADRETFEKSAARLESKGAPAALARDMAGLDALYAVLDATEVARETGCALETVARLYFALAGDLELRWFGERITALPTDTPWQSLARNALRDDLASQQRALTGAVARLAPGSGDPAAMMAAWKEHYAQPIARLAAMREELKRAGTLDLAVLSVLLRELRGLA